MSREYVLEPFCGGMRLRIDYEHELNPQQLAAVTAPPGPSLVIAGAGSGKTRTLTYRVAYLLEHGVSPERILLLTFTNKAAGEMMRRVSELLGRELPALWGGTFHAIGNRILRHHAPLLGFERDFTILDREDARHLIATCIAEAEIDVKATRFPKAEVLGEIFSLAVNTARPIAEILAAEYDYFAPLADRIEAVHRRYEARKRASNAMDFDDLLVLWFRLLREHAEARDQYQRRFEFILVDEYQDTNKLQSDLVDLLAARHRNIMVVGDDAQSIYAWRGANFANILRFPERYPDAKIYKIETNYRSTPEILTLANAAIAANARQFAKRLTPARPSGARPALVVCDDASEQAAFVAQRVLELRDEGVDLNRMAVLYRSHFHALELQLELTRRNIPFSITSGVRFFEQAHIKDLTAYLRLIHNPRDELAFKRLVLMLPGVGAKAAARLWTAYLAHAPQPAANTASGVAAALEACAGSVPSRTASAWKRFTETMAQLETPPTRNDTAGMIELALAGGYDDYLKQSYANYRSRLDDLKQLAAFAATFDSLEAFLTQMALLSNVEAEEDRPGARDTERLRLSTVHQAKGLEFDVVFVIMLCEGMFPSARSAETEEGLEEERRLFYVAITRARNELYLSYPRVRAGYGNSSITLQHPSRFLEEIPKHLLEEWHLRA